MECTNVIYGTLKAALLFYKAFRQNMEAKGFEINAYDWCTANKLINGKPMTIVWHVDDVKASHAEKEVLEEYIEYLRSIYDDEEIGTLKVNYGPRHEFLGMILDYSEPGKLIVDMSDSISKMVEEFEMDYKLPKSAKTAVADHLFKVNPDCQKLNEKMASDFHTYTAKGLLKLKQLEWMMCHRRCCGLIIS